MLLGLRCLPETQVKMSDNHLDRRVEFEREVWTLSSQGESNQQSGVTTGLMIIKMAPNSQKRDTENTPSVACGMFDFDP